MCTTGSIGGKNLIIQLKTCYFFSIILKKRFAISSSFIENCHWHWPPQGLAETHKVRNTFQWVRKEVKKLSQDSLTSQKPSVSSGGRGDWRDSQQLDRGPWVSFLSKANMSQFWSKLDRGPWVSFLIWVNFRHKLTLQTRTCVIWSALSKTIVGLIIVIRKCLNTCF